MFAAAPVLHLCPALQELTWMASVDDQEKQSSKSWLRHAVESALIALDRPAGFLVPVGAAVVCIKAVSSFLDALLVHQTENAFLGEWACASLQSSFALKFALSAQCLLAVFGNKTDCMHSNFAALHNSETTKPVRFSHARACHVACCPLHACCLHSCQGICMMLLICLPPYTALILQPSLPIVRSQHWQLPSLWCMRCHKSPS